ncbi:MAG: hypothetical protein R3E13_08395 [Alphaproteobacteria bacterium]
MPEQTTLQNEFDTSLIKPSRQDRRSVNSTGATLRQPPSYEDRGQNPDNGKTRHVILKRTSIKEAHSDASTQNTTSEEDALIDIRRSYDLGDETSFFKTLAKTGAEDDALDSTAENVPADQQQWHGLTIVDIPGGPGDAL